MPKIVKISLPNSFGIPLRRHREEKASLVSCGKTTALAVNLGLFQFTGVSGLCLQNRVLVSEMLDGFVIAEDHLRPAYQGSDLVVRSISHHCRSLGHKIKTTRSSC